MSTPRRYTDSELDSMLSDLESDLVERKESMRGDAPSGIREGITPQPFDQQDGFLVVPTGPGLGVEIDESAVRRLASH